MNKEKAFVIDGVDYYFGKIYLEYDQPELFSISNIVGNQYIVMLISLDPEKWLMTPVSARRLMDLEYGKIDIKDIFVKPLIPQVEIIYGEERCYKKKQISCAEIPDEYLPESNVRLNWENIPMPHLQDDIIEFSNKRQKDILDIRIASNRTKEHTIDSKSLGSFLTIINDVVLNIAKLINKKKGLKRGLTAGCSLQYVGSYPGSFGIRLEGEDYTDLLDSTRLTPVLIELFNLLNIHDVNDLKKTVRDNPFEYSKALRKLLKYSSDNESLLEFSFTTPLAINKGNVVWEKDEAKSALEYLDTLISDEIKDESYVGDLISVSKKNNRFEFVTDSEEEIKGVIDESLKERVFHVKCHAEIEVKKFIKINNAEEIEEKFRLVGLKELC